MATVDNLLEQVSKAAQVVAGNKAATLEAAGRAGTAAGPPPESSRMAGPSESQAPASAS